MTEPAAPDRSTSERPHRTWTAAGTWAAWAAAVLAVAVAAVLVADHLRYRRQDPLNSTDLAAAKARLARSPRDRALARQIRQDDLDLRRDHFRHVTRAGWGRFVLLGCAAVFLVGARSALALGKRLGRPTGKAPDVAQQTRAARWGRRAVGALAGVLAAAAVAPVAVEAYLRTTTAPIPPPHAADPAEVARYWPQFRGPGGQGVSAYDNVPTAWDANSGRGIVWKVPVPLGGKGSPVVWGDRIFLSGASRQKRQVYCYAAATGKLLWRGSAANIPGSPARPKKAYEDTGYAASTPVVDDRRVFAIFANGDLACFDHDGKRVWAKALGMPVNSYGHGSSLAMYRNLVLVLWDQGNLEDYMSRLLAFDGETGRLVWQQRRPVSASWASPVVVRGAGREQLITSANPWVIAYDPASGTELWRANHMDGGDVASTVAFADGVAYAVSAETILAAIDANGTGDVTDSHLLWEGEDGLPDITSPLTDGKCVWLLPTDGLLTCYDAKTGKKLYEHEFEKIFNASPALAGGKLYLFGIKGAAYIAEAGREFKLLATNQLGEAVYASPAFQDGRIYVRGKKHLFCIGKGR